MEDVPPRASAAAAVRRRRHVALLCDVRVVVLRRDAPLSLPLLFLISCARPGYPVDVSCNDFALHQKYVFGNLTSVIFISFLSFAF